MRAFLEAWGVLGVFLAIIGTGMGLPIPEELPVVIGGGICSTGAVSWLIMLPVTILAVVIGDSFLYFIGRIWGAKLVERPFVQKHLLKPERLESIRENFHKYGIRILLFARLTPGIRAPIFLTSGIIRLPFTQFLIADGLYAVPGVGVLFLLGYWFTDSVVAFFEEDAEIIKAIVILVVVVGVAGYFAYKFFRKPVVTGDPDEVPKIATPLEKPLDSVAGKIISIPESLSERKP